MGSSFNPYKFGWLFRAGSESGEGKEIGQTGVVRNKSISETDAIRVSLNFWQQEKPKLDYYYKFVNGEKVQLL